MKLCHIYWEVSFKNDAILEKYLDYGLTTSNTEGATQRNYTPQP